jgi:hypothetical protein
VRPWLYLDVGTWYPFFLEPEDVKSISLGAIWSFSKATGLPWFWYGAQSARF